MRIVFMGTPDFGVPILKALKEKYEVVLVVTQPDKEVGRKRLIQESPIKETAKELAIPLFQPESIQSDYEPILKANPDLIITAAYGQLIPPILLDYPKFKCINVHASLLPKLRGGAPVHKAIIRGYKVTGVSVMYMAQKMDQGDILAQRETEIADSDNLDSLYHRLSFLGRDLLMETLPLVFEGKIEAVKQVEEEATYAKNVSKKMEHIVWEKGARAVFNLIRGLSPNPGAYGIIHGLKVKFYASNLQKVVAEKNGVVLEALDRFVIGFKDGALEITEIQVEGKKKVAIKDFLHGQKLIAVGDIFE